MTNDSPKPIEGAINVGLAIFWSKPFEEPIYQEISHRAAANPAQWAKRLNSDERLWLVGKVDTMAIYGERVAILDRCGPWVKAAAVSQPNRHNQQGNPGYPGWIFADQISYDSVYLTEQSTYPEAAICVPQATLFNDAALSGPLGSLSYQTRLPVLSEFENRLQVRLPDGQVGYLSRSDAQKTTEVLFSHQSIISEARRFLDLHYLWGGTSSYGFDCSGFMFRLYQSQGISIPRDASEQAREGVLVSKEDLRPGDLLFFDYKNQPGKIHHVGMYIGEGMMIHSPNSQSAIRIESFETGVYGEEYWGARRYR